MERPELVVVVALGEDRPGLLRLLSQVDQRVPVGPATTVAVVTPDLPVGPDRTLDLLLAGCPPGRETATILVTPGPDGVASELVARADLVVAARASDAAVPAVRSAAVPVVTLVEAEAGPAAFDVPTAPERSSVLLVDVDEGPAAAEAALDPTTADLFVLHTRRGGVDAARFLHLRGRVGFDLAVLGRPHPVFGTADPSHLSPEVLAVSRAAVAPLLRWLPRAGSLEELIGWVARTDLADRLRLLVLPAVATRSFREIPDVDIVDLPEWIGDSGVLPRIHRSGAAVDVAALRAAGQAKPVKVPDVRAWVRDRRWSDRARLALPWKGGLLSRAMRGRW